MNKFRTLNADEIDVRVQSVTKTGTGAVLLLYKDARVDMNVLDETYGSFSWRREHSLINGNLYCTVSIQNPDTGEWVSKSDVGVESQTEATKGEASDSFKRACFNWGIGRELYTAPFIYVALSEDEVYKVNDTFRVRANVHFRVGEIGYDNGIITTLRIFDNKNAERYTFLPRSAARAENETKCNTKKKAPKNEIRTLTAAQLSDKKWLDALFTALDNRQSKSFETGNVFDYKKIITENYSCTEDVPDGISTLIEKYEEHLTELM